VARAGDSAADIAVPIVLNVEDSDVCRSYRTAVLHEAGFAVVEARTGGDALQRATEHIGLVLLDVLLPDVDGFEVCRRLKANPLTALIPVLHVSAAFPDDAHYVEGLRAGGDGYLPEPVSPDLLIEAIRTLLRRSAAHAEIRRARQEAERAMADSERRYRALFEHAPYGIFQAAPDGRLLAANEALARMLGYATSEALLAMGSVLPCYVNASDRLRLTTEIERRRVITASEVLWRRHDGTPIRVRIASRRIHEGCESFVEDVTEREQLEEELRQSQKLEAIGKLAGGIAHDFNNALTVILGYADMLVHQLGTELPIGRDLDEMRKAAQHAAALTHQLLTFARRQPLHLSVVDVNAVVVEAETMLARLLGETIVIDIRRTPDACRITADKSQLQQVLVNLAVNARDAMPAGGTLTIETDRIVADLWFTAKHPAIEPGKYVRLTVCDTGTGMDQDTQQQLFEPFFTTKDVGKGTGLGLSTVYGIVRQSGGHVLVDSEIGRGTRFDIYLPEANDGVEHPSLKESVAVGSAHVLVVEDSPAVRALTVAALQRHGYQVTEAMGPREALELPDEVMAGTHLLLTDMVMPFMSGSALAKRLCARQPTLRVLYMSGYLGKTADPIRDSAAGHFLLHKPFTTAALLSAVADALRVPVNIP
jgi:PAS domain S-box-containing protein